MITWSSRVAIALFVFASTVHADTKQGAKGAGKGEAMFVKANAVKWDEAPPDLPKGAMIAVLHGDPMKKGPYTIRLKAPDGYKIAPHWHTNDEQLTVLSGMFILRMGRDTEGHELDAGSYHFLPGKMHHSAEAKGETVIQISGTGPFDIHYLNAADNPNPKTARK